jgi:amidohydrolase
MTINFAHQPYAIIPEIQAQIPMIRNIRRDIHRHPELCFTEYRTADLIVEKLQEWGIPLHRGLGKTGVVGILKAGRSERSIGLRADMDALPIIEANEFAHASQYHGKMHACGHDGHTAMLLAAAKYLVEHPRFDGTVYFIFQPAEEGGGGARAMIEDGLFKLFPMQAVFGMHNWPGLAVGQFAVSSGAVMASLNTFRIKIRGRGCHAALPHQGLDPVPVAAEIILALQTILTRNLSPLESGLLSVTQIHAGNADNVIADDCNLSGTVRCFDDELLARMEQRMFEITQHICLAHGLEFDFAFQRCYPATINDQRQVEVSRQVLAKLVGESNVCDQQPTMGAEDFAFMLQCIPGSYCFIGNGDGAHRDGGHGAGPCSLHNASYDFNDELLALGASYWAKLVTECLNP